MTRRPADATRCFRATLLTTFAALTGVMGPVQVAGAQAPASYAERVLARAELVAYWRLGETSPPTARDAEGSRHGTYVGGVTLNQAGALSADPDRAAKFDGSVTESSLPTLFSDTSFTIEGWQRLDAAAAGNNALYGHPSGVRLMPRPTGFYADALVGGARFALQSSVTSNVGAWVHWTLTRSGSTLALYRNGVRVAQRTDLPAATASNLSGQIGRIVSAYPTKGAIDEVAVYSGALGATEVAGDYAARDTAPGTTPPPPLEPRASGPFYVDRASRGGVCADTRTAAQAASVATPWCSVERAAAAVPDGSTVLVRTATYPDVTIDGTIRSTRVTFKPYASELPVLHGLSVTNSSNLRFESFRITEVTHMDQVSQVQMVGNDISPNDVRVVIGSDLLFEDNTFHDLTMQIDRASGRCIPPRCGYGIRINRGTDVTIRGNRFQRIPADGIQSGTAVRYLIEDNLFEDITPFVDPNEHCDAIQFYAGSDGAILRRNTFRRTRGPLLGDPNVGTAPQKDMVIENNLLVAQRDWGLQIYNAPRLKLLNNTVWDARVGVAIRDIDRIAEKTTGVVALNNIFEFFDAQTAGFARLDYNLIGSVNGATPRGTHVISGPPRFVEPASLDYRLAGGSPGIDAGTSDGAPVRDLKNAARRDTPAIADTGAGALGGFYEIGALEFTDEYRTPAGSYADRILGVPGLLSYWRLGEASGATAQDENGGRHGTYAQGVVLGAADALAGDANTAAAFDGVDDHVSLPAMPASVDFTVEGWQRLAATSAGNNVLYGNTGTLRLMPRPTGFYAGVTIGGTEYVVQGTAGVNTDRWVHWAMVRRGATMEIYRDGILVGSRSNLPATTPASLGGTIGRQSGVAYTTKGSIDEVAVYSAALGATEIRAHRDLGTP